MSDLSQVQPTDDHELRRFAQTLWASDDYRSWREQALHAVADGSIYDEPPLEDVNHGEA